MQNVIDFIDKIAATSSRNEKVAILKNIHQEIVDEDERDTFFAIVKMIYSTGVTFGVTFNEEWKHSGGLAKTRHLMTLLDALARRELTGNAAITATRKVLEESVDDSVFKLGKLCLDKSLGCGVDEKTIRKLWPSLLPFKPDMMKCEPANEKSLEAATWPGLLQVKSDGMRLKARVKDGIVECMFTFNGSEFSIDNPLLIQELESIGSEFSNDIWLDGELLFVDVNGKTMARKKGNGLANKILQKTATPDVHDRARIALWDAIPHEGVKAAVYNQENNGQRFDSLKNVMENMSLSYVSLIEHVIVDDLEECRAVVDGWIARGEEGGILKNLEAVWEGKRSKYCFKFKSEKENELKATGVVDGKRKLDGLIGSITMQSSDGELQVDVSGISMFDRCQWSADYYNREIVRKETNDGVVTEFVHEPSGDFKLGDIFTIRYNELIDKDGSERYSLLLPRIVEKRFDKNDADSLETIKATKNRKGK